MYYVSAALRLCHMQHDLVFTKGHGTSWNTDNSWGKEGRKNDILADMQKWCQTLHQPYYITASYIPPLTGTEEALGLRDHSLDKFQQDLTVNGSWGMLRLSFRNAKRLAPNSTQVLKRPLHCLHIDAHRLFLASAWKAIWNSVFQSAAILLSTATSPKPSSQAKDPNLRCFHWCLFQPIRAMKCYQWLCCFRPFTKSA